MNYKNGKDVLPPRLLKELQHYAQGELIYVPKPEQQRALWGELSGTRMLNARRNEQIYESYCKGTTMAELAAEYHLSTDSIRKIVVKARSVAAKQHS
ncbi:CD3324 family protein [Paenibacillus sp. JX-17]|uniref:CD3324 family protein n=1 Tax=Paenibacillus lacisoli TaxID=3064525 RepID=A0ABT9CFP6_9BACL|nr:CD3324 family protein [Paenibacillus sp. JX-17]MDO7908103.1 CD3324 family protein [Paenibacillus sp. JX-17]